MVSTPSDPRPARRRTVTFAFAVAIVCYWLLESAYVSLRATGGLGATFANLVPTGGVELAHRLVVTALLVGFGVWTYRLQSRTKDTRKQLVRTAEALADSERSVQLGAKVFEHAIEGIVVTDPDGTIQTVNPSFTAITGYSAEEAIGRNPRILKSDRHDDAFYEEMWRSLAETGSWSGQIWNRNKRGEAYPEWLNINAVRDADGTVSNYVAVFHDLSDLERSRERIQHLAYHDPLTGLPNRLLLDDRLRVALAQARRSRSMVAVLYLDVDDFKRVNDTYGHAAGDLVLQQVARRLEGCVREEDTVARRGGDEFVVVLSQVRSPVAAMRVGQAILRTLANPLAVGGATVRIGATLGAAIYPVDGSSAEELLRHADVALYGAKERGKGVFQPFTRDMSRRLRERIEIEDDLRRAVDDTSVVVEYQPVLDAASDQMVAVEALARWRREDGAVLTPDRFLDLAEDNGLVVPIGLEVLRMAARDLATWHAAGHHGLRLVFNLSARQILEDDLAETVRASLDAAGVAATSLECEVAEDVIADLDPPARTSLERLAALGAAVVVDRYRGADAPPCQLADLPVHAVKLDRTLVERLHDPAARRLVAALIAMTRTLGLGVSAGGVSEPSHLGFLREHGVDQVQGFLFGRPTTARSIERRLRFGPPAADEHNRSDAAQS